RKLATPSPPRPACTSMIASSTNFISRALEPRAARRAGNKKALSGDRACRWRTPSRSGGNHAHRLPALRALLREPDLPGRLGEERVVAPHADVHAGMHLRAPLADADLARVHELAAE